MHTRRTLRAGEGTGFYKPGDTKDSQQTPAAREGHMDRFSCTASGGGCTLILDSQPPGLRDSKASQSVVPCYGASADSSGFGRSGFSRGAAPRCAGGLPSLRLHAAVPRCPSILGVFLFSYKGISPIGSGPHLYNLM